MTTKNKVRLLESLARGVPVQISSYGSSENLSAIEWTVEVSGVGSNGQAECLEVAISQIYALASGYSFGYLFFRGGVNPKSAVARHRGAWGGLPMESATWLGREGRASIEVDNLEGFIGYSPYNGGEYPNVAESFRKYDSAILLYIDDVKEYIGLAAENCLPKDGCNALHLGMWLAEQGRAMALWLYPSFDDREAAAYLLGPTREIAEVYSALSRAELPRG